MNKLNRRHFLSSTGKKSVGVTAAIAALPSARVNAAPSDKSPDRLRLAVVGLRGRGGTHAGSYAKRSDCEIAYLCDVDESLFPARVSEVEKIQGTAPKTTGDFRRALDDKTIDA